MTVKFFAYYRDPAFAGCKEMEWHDSAETVIALCRQIADRFGDKFRAELLTADGNGISDRSIVMVNGRRIDFIGGPDAPLRDSDTILIFPVVAGG
ncbi:MAG: MoaD family protein [Mogibacterium sp.]|nr:MoaD family protein [Mogibacterium sp.]